ncbi:MAG: EAL domain-containing protein [Sulfuricellaceae bacterium]|nr:EAL domain-containing protein [Sulfuricellaceae bacterium]
MPELESALAEGRLVYYYQPKISLVTGKTSGAEALLRWIEPDGTVIPPAEFIPLAEESGFITEIARSMFPKLIADLLIIHDVNDALTVSFNLTAQDFASPEITDLIRDAVLCKKVDPKRLQIELTEASILDGSKPIARVYLQTLVDLGLTLAMDDFGTGYSSIDTLSLWPFSVIKIDKGLIGRMHECPKCTAIIQSSIRMAHILGINIVAEGIETSEVYDFLMQAGCTEAQGFWMGRPLPMEAFLTFIKKDPRWSGLPIGLIHIAQLDHIHWRKTLIDQVINSSFEGSAGKVRRFTAEMDHTQCRLGCWIYGHGQEFKGRRAFDLLEEPHRRLHEAGRKLIDAAERDAPHNEIADLLRALTQESSILLGLLQELENQAVI